MSELAHLFSPIKIGNVEIRNRILQSAHITNFAENGLPSERHLRYTVSEKDGDGQAHRAVLRGERLARFPSAKPRFPFQERNRENGQT